MRDLNEFVDIDIKYSTLHQSVLFISYPIRLTMWAVSYGVLASMRGEVACYVMWERGCLGVIYTG